MVEYHEQARKCHEKEAAEEAAVAADLASPDVIDSTHIIQQSWPPAYTTLAEMYSLEDMDFSTPDNVEEQSLEQEYQSYVTAALLKAGTDTLKFWEVHDLQW